jgi:threonine synthase
MNFYSTQNQKYQVGLAEAVIKGLAPDQGLFMPIEIPSLSPEFFAGFSKLSFREIGYQVIQTIFGDDLTHEQVRELVDHTLVFDAPLVEVAPDQFSLELFHGPTLAFKDFGARFCSKLMSMLLADSDKKVRVLVATSGDTGSAVANGFLGVEGVEVIILFPKGKVSELQEKQFTTLGQNIICLEIDGVFDDCQRLVKEAFLDEQLNQKLLLTSANSINIARWIPQVLYYFYAVSRLPQTAKKIVFSVPSGNFGNLAAGILSQRMGLPIAHFVAATNLNKVVPEYLAGADFVAMNSLQTVSNSMDVGNPSNFPRLLALYGGDSEQLRSQVTGYFYGDAETVETIVQVAESGYILDPHGAVGYLGLREFMDQNPGYQGVFLETAHPGKFREVVEEALGRRLELPERLSKFLEGAKSAISLPRDFGAFRAFLDELKT